MRYLILAALLPMQALADAAGTPLRHNGVCRAAATYVEREYGLPPQLLSAISLTETGVKQRATKDQRAVFMAWPWTINVNGRGYFFRDKAEAVAKVRQLLARGQRSIDVGCMQVNLKHHPQAFASLERAFDPLTNVRYAARFVVNLSDRTGSWVEAVGRYHSGTPSRAEPYRRMVFNHYLRERAGQERASAWQ